MRLSARLVLIPVILSIFVVQPARAATNYEQPLLFQWSIATLDLFIVPPHHGQVFNGNGVLNGASANELVPLTNSYMRAIENSVNDWQRAINQYGSATLKDGLKINKYVLGRDVPPAGTRPEIVITADENKGVVLGIAIKTGGGPCFVLNSMFFVQSMTYEDMFNINAQEYGHCLGLGHVNDALGYDGSAPLIHDPMNGVYPDNAGTAGNDLHCVSNLNVKGLEEVYRMPLGTGTGGAAIIASASYSRPRFNATAPATGCIY